MSPRSNTRTDGAPRRGVPARPATLVALAALLSLTLLGCATAPVPTTQMAVAEAAVGRATSAGTAEAAPVPLRIATLKLADARTALAAGDNARALQLAEQAELDALVAELSAQSVRSQRAARETEDAARALREEINRKTVR